MREVFLSLVWKGKGKKKKKGKGRRGRPRERPGVEPQRKKGQPWVLRRGAGQQWFHVTERHGEEEIYGPLSQGDQGIK